MISFEQKVVILPPDFNFSSNLTKINKLIGKEFLS